MQTALTPETKQLLEQYISAFNNLYAITPVFRAWRIIKKQNPGLDLTQEDFLAFLQDMDEDTMHCAVIGQEEICDDGREPTPPMKREIILEYLYALGDFEDYEKLKEEQEDKPFYVPEKEHLLLFADDSYRESTREYLTLQTFLQDSLKAKNVESVMDDFYMMAVLEGPDFSAAQFSLERVGKVSRFPSSQLEEEFFRLYKNMCSQVRMHKHRGHTPQEIHILCG